MAHLRLRIQQYEYEIEGSEEFVARMEPKLTDFLEKHLSASTFSSVSAPLPPKEEEFVKQFLERYNNPDYWQEAGKKIL